MAIPRSRRSLDDLSPEKRAKVEAMMARRHTPEARTEEIRDREELAEEYRNTGTIEAAGEPMSSEMLIQLRQLIVSLREYRERSGLSLAAISERSGIDQPALSRLENGHGNPTFATLSRYVQAIGAVVKFEVAVG